MKFNESLKINNSSRLSTIYLIGDSHAGHYGAVMTHLVNKNKLNFVMHPQGNGLKVLNKKGTEEYILAPLREYKNNFKKGDVIIFSAAIDKYYKEEQDWTKQYENFIQQTQNIGMKFILISPTPTFSGGRDTKYTCQEEWFRPSWAISSPEFCLKQVSKREWLVSNKEPITLIQKFLSAKPEVSYLDAWQILCPDPHCKNYDQFSLLYKDNTHLTSYGAMKLSKTIETFIRSK